MSVGAASPEQLLVELRRRADEDFLAPSTEHRPGRHSAELLELGLRVSITRSRYPNLPDGADMYAVTISRVRADGPPAEAAVRHALAAAFGSAADRATARPGGPAVRMFRVPAAETVQPNR